MTTLVVILNWRQPEVTIECVRAVQAMKPAAEAILLIDNGSGDGSPQRLQAALPDIPLLALPDNLGFAGGINHGLRWAMANGFDNALLLNNDAFPRPDMLAYLLAESAPGVALLSPKIFYQAAPTTIWFAGGRQHRQLLELRDTGRGQPDGPLFSHSRDVDYLLGTGLLVNLQAVQKVGLLDERYFMYYEDLDWSIRLRQAGYRLRLVSEAHLDHRVSFSTGGEDSPHHRYYLARSSILFFTRYGRQGWLWAIILFRLSSALKMVVRLLLRGHFQTARAYVHGLSEGWRLAMNQE